MDHIIVYILFILLLLCFCYLLYASGSIYSGVYVKAVCRLNTDEKIVALTFDDGPDAAITPQVLDILKKYEVPAAFFCIGKKIAENRNTACRIHQEGHLIGNHSYSHSSFFPFYAYEKIVREMQQCNDEIIRISRQKTLPLFRPPFGVTNPTFRNLINVFGYTVIGWNIRSFDTTNQQHPEKVIRRVLKRIKPGCIVLFHDNLKNCPQIVETIINEIQAKGYRFVRIDEYL